MSILQEYEKIRKSLRPGEFEAIERYLDRHPELFLSDIYYKQEQYEKFDTWWEAEQKSNTQKELVADKIIQISKLLNEICEIENEHGEPIVNCFSKETMAKNPFPLSLDEFSMELIEYARSILVEDLISFHTITKGDRKNE